MELGAQISLTQEADFADEIEAKLLCELRNKSTQSENAAFSLALNDVSGATLGGLSASTAYGWLLIKVLFVEPPARGQGYGRDLIDAALSRAKELGCHSAWLDTSDAAAQHFYLSQGFVTFGALANELNQAPMGHQRWFMKRVI